jgi:phospholipid transport system substrate-binding protein
MLMNLYCHLLFALLLCWAPRWRRSKSPDALGPAGHRRCPDIVRQDKDIQSGDTAKAIKLVETKVLPYFDFQRMTALAVGRNWSKATPEQKQAPGGRVQDAAGTHLLECADLVQGPDVVLQARARCSRRHRCRGQDRSRAARQQAVQLDYALEKQGDGWKVYDVIVAGVSLVTNYRDTFARKSATRASTA